MTPTIVVIGGGFTGLSAAYLLGLDLKGSARVVVLEGDKRPGGSVRTGMFERHGVPYDAGAAEIYDIAGSGLSMLIRDLGLPTVRLDATPWFFLQDGSVLRSERDFVKTFGRDGVDSLSRFWRRGMGLRPFNSFLGSGGVADNRHPWSRKSFAQVLEEEIPNEKVRKLTQIQAHSDIAAEPRDTNGVFAFDNLLIDHPGYCWLKAIDGGNEQLVSRLAARVDAQNGGPGSAVWTSSRVSSVTCLQDGSFSVEFDRSGARQELLANFVVVALTPRDVRTIEWRPASVAESVRRHLEHHDVSTHYLRVTILTPDRRWKDVAQEDYFITDAFDGVTVYDQSRFVPRDKPYGIMSWLLAGKSAADMSRLSDTEVCLRIRVAMPPILSRVMGGARGAPIDCKVDRYMNSVSRQPGGIPILADSQKHTPCSPKNLIFTGDYLYDSTLHGCLESATVASEMISTALGVPQKFVIAGAASVDPETVRELEQAKDRWTANRRALPFLKGKA